LYEVLSQGSPAFPMGLAKTPDWSRVVPPALCDRTRHRSQQSSWFFFES